MAYDHALVLFLILNLFLLMIQTLVYDLVDGMYQLYSLDRRGTIHRIGFFKIKR